MATWGATTLRIDNTTYSPPEADIRINEIEILPDPSSLSTPATVLQQGGTGRKRASFEGFVKSFAAYNALQDDKIGGTVRTFTGLEGETLSGIIEMLRIVERYPPGLSRIRYAVSIVEA